MLTVVGDVIEYDGKPFAVITAPLSGWRMDALDCANNYDMFLDSVIDETVDEHLSDIVDAFMEAIEEAESSWTLHTSAADWMRSKVKELLK